MDLGTVDLTLLTTAQAVASPSSVQFLIAKATVNNQDSVARTVSVYRVPSLGAPGPGNVIVDALAIPAGETFALPLSGQAVMSGYTLQALASAGGVVNLNLTYQVVAAS